MLHDIANDKFFVHDFLLAANKHKVVFPVKEKKTSRKPAKIVANVWRAWLDDGAKDI